MPRPNTFPYFRPHTINELESLKEGRVKTEEVTEDLIYEAMSRLVDPKGNTPEVVSMPVRVEEIQYKRSRGEIARISMQLVLLDKDFQPSIARVSHMADGMWSFEKPIDIIGAKPMKIGFLLPSLPDDFSTDPFTVASADIRETVLA